MKKKTAYVSNLTVNTDLPQCQLGDNIFTKAINFRPENNSLVNINKSAVAPANSPKPWSELPVTGIPITAIVLDLRSTDFVDHSMFHTPLSTIGTVSVDTDGYNLTGGNLIIDSLLGAPTLSAKYCMEFDIRPDAFDFQGSPWKNIIFMAQGGAAIYIDPMGLSVANWTLGTVKAEFTVDLHTFYAVKIVYTEAETWIYINNVLIKHGDYGLGLNPLDLDFNGLGLGGWAFYSGQRLQGVLRNFIWYAIYE